MDSSMFDSEVDLKMIPDINNWIVMNTSSSDLARCGLGWLVPCKSENYKCHIFGWDCHSSEMLIVDFCLWNHWMFVIKKFRLRRKFETTFSIQSKELLAFPP